IQQANEPACRTCPPECRPEIHLMEPGTYTLTAGLGHLDVTDDLTLSGAGADKTVIDGNNTGRVLQIGEAGGRAINVILKDLTIRNGKADAEKATLDNSCHQKGGGICVAGANVTLQ